MAAVGLRHEPVGVGIVSQGREALELDPGGAIVLEAETGLGFPTDPVCHVDAGALPFAIGQLGADIKKAPAIGEVNQRPGDQQQAAPALGNAAVEHFGMGLAEAVALLGREGRGCHGDVS